MDTWKIIALLALLGNVFLLLLLIFKGRGAAKSGNAPKAALPKGSTPKEVGKFYNEQTDNFLKVYGEVIQAFRTTNVSILLDYQIESMGLEKDWKVLDAGCGVCGPARHFAKNAGVQVEAITISKDQVEKSKAYIKRDGLEGAVNVQLGDYHKMEALFPKDEFDAVYFLESFGHAENHETVIQSALQVLKPGGVLYIKDLFRKIGNYPGHDAAIDEEIKNINKAYRYNVADLYQVLHVLRKNGFIIANLKTIDLKLEEFENLTISNDFQELTGINKIENLQEYVFPVDFFEIKCYKPWNDVMFGNSRYFLQNLYWMQVEGKKQEEL